jgi:hypothetical protein
MNHQARGIEQIRAEGRRRILIRLEVLDVAPETDIAEVGEGLGADFERELAMKAEQYYVMAAWTHPRPEEVSTAIRNELTRMAQSVCLALTERRKDLDFRVLKEQRIFSTDSEGRRVVRVPEGREP